MHNGDIVLTARQISKTFPGVKALQSVDFTLRAGTVHALMGENGAGKSTLVKCIMGLQVYDSGELYVHDRLVRFTHPKRAIEAGIAMIEQELTPVEEMTVAENITLGREFTTRAGFLDYKRINELSEHYIRMLGVSIDVTRKMKQLSLAEVQLVEIAKALSFNSSIIIMDEPTSAIGEKEVEILFSVVRTLREQGKAIIYVSHRMEEIFTITDEITVLRDGKYVDTVKTRETSRNDIIRMMVGKKLEEEYLKFNKPEKQVRLNIEGLSQKGVLEDISLDLKKGEILGLFGLMGSGRSEFCDALFGASRADSGTIDLDGKRLRIRRPKDAMRAGIAYVTEDRKNSGLHVGASIRDNISLTYLKELSRNLLIDRKEEQRLVRQMIEKFAVKTPSENQLVINLSGGNQQKVVLGKWLIRDPEILILDEPTRGIDVGAKREIYRFMSEFANQGGSIILISSEIPEILSMSDRIAVFKDGRKRIELSRQEADQNNLMHYASSTKIESESVQ